MHTVSKMSDKSLIDVNGYMPHLNLYLSIFYKVVFTNHATDADVSCSSTELAS